MSPGTVLYVHQQRMTPPSAYTRSAPAKINLGLHVLRKRDDGYHDIETVFHQIAWADTVRVSPADDLSMTCSDPSLPTDDRNLCMQAARRFRDALGVTLGATLHLEKRVPYGAGLGGGSSDAVATLLALCDLWMDGETPLPILYEVATEIGSDVPFFLESARNGPAAFARGRGEVLEPLMTDEGPFALEAPVAVVVPPVMLPTPEAYGYVTPNETARPDLRSIVTTVPVHEWTGRLVNDFEAPIVEQFPETGDARDLLLRHGARYASLSGSGSSVFGVFPDAASADAAVRDAETSGYRAARG